MYFVFSKFKKHLDDIKFKHLSQESEWKVYDDSGEIGEPNIKNHNWTDHLKYLDHRLS